MKQPRGPIVWDPFFKVNFTYIYYETGPYRLNWGTFPLPWLNGVIKSVFLERSQRELGCLSHFVQRGRQSCPQGVILFHTERLTSFKHTIVSSNPTVLPCCNAIHSVTASISASLSHLLPHFLLFLGGLHVTTWTTNRLLSFIMTEKETFKRGGTRRRHQYREAVCGFVKSPDGTIKAVVRDLDLAGLLNTICDLSRPSRGSTGPFEWCVLRFIQVSVYRGTFIMSYVSQAGCTGV